MRIVVHDYSGHAFPVQLSRSLAQRGHQVLHLYSGSFTTPQGPLQKRPDDPENFQSEAVLLAERVDKKNLAKRRAADIEHGRKVAARVASFKPEVVLSGNTGPDVQRPILEQTHAIGAKFVFWVQDLVGQAVMRLVGDRWLGVGKAIGAYYINLENRLLSQSDKVVVIAEDFRPHLPADIRNSGRVEVVENWALIDEIPLLPRDNAWAGENGFLDGLNFVYSGTLGMKHNPELLVKLAETLKGKGRMIVISEGASVEFLKSREIELGLDNLHLLPFQPFGRMPEVLAAADVLVAILEPDAGVFSVPSKVLTYLCAQRPLLLAVPPENLAARIVSGSGAGFVSPPDDVDAFVSNATTLANDAGLRGKMGAAARSYAEKTFDIDRITGEFERILKF